MTREEAKREMMFAKRDVIADSWIDQAYEVAIKALEQPEPQWIPCSNTIDIPDYEVLCCDKRGNELIGWLFYSNNQWICESKGEIMYGTIAWMSPPKPYAER